MSLFKRAALSVGLAAIGMSFGLAGSAQANYLPGLTNLNFLSYTGSAPKASFTSVNPTGWTGGSGLIFIDAPGTSASSPVTACGGTYLSTYGCPSTLAIPGGYNFVEADANPVFESGFNYHLSGLTAGQTYQLSFYQAASQQRGFANGKDTTEQWIVSLGTSALTKCNGCGPYDAYYGSHQSTYSNPDASASVVATNKMTTPSGGMTDWQYVTVNLKADAPTQLLSFLAWGNDGTTANLPPIAFLAGVNSPAGLVPEPAALSVFGVGLLGLGGIALRRRPKQRPAA